MKKQEFIVKIEFAKSGLIKRIKNGQKEPHDFNFYVSGKYLEYIARNEAVIKQEFEVNKQDIRQNNINPFEKFHPSKYTSYSSSGVYELFSEDLKAIDIQQQKNKLVQLNKNQIIWEMILNPGEFGIENLMYDRSEWNSLLNKHLKKFIKVNDMNPDNITGYWTLHTNTKFPHIHLSFYEKEPDYFNANGNHTFKTKGSFSKQSIANLKKFIINDINQQSKNEYNSLFEEKAIVWDLRKQVKTTLTNLKIKKDNLDISIAEEVEDIQQALVDTKNKTYANCDNHLKQKIMNVFEYMKNNNKQIKDLYDLYNNKINDLQKTQYTSTTNQNLRDEFIKKEQNEFESQIGNLVIKICLKEIDLNKTDHHSNTPITKQQNNKNWYYIKKQKSSFESYEKNKKIYLSNKLNWLFKNWEWEANGVLFKQKIEALNRFRSGEVFKSKM